MARQCSVQCAVWCYVVLVVVRFGLVPFLKAALERFLPPLSTPEASSRGHYPCCTIPDISQDHS
jgi:hypothetical protein